MDENLIESILCEMLKNQQLLLKCMLEMIPTPPRDRSVLLAEINRRMLRTDELWCSISEAIDARNSSDGG